tara:strand:- start:18300 stop:19025 length:726 start_codon:yes stop_codon:yes gene_type:complete
MANRTTVIDTLGTLADDDVTAILLPVQTGCLGYFELGGTLVRSQRNWVNPALTATVVGSPTVAADGVTSIGNSAYFNTGIAEPLALTYLLAYKGTQLVSTDPATSMIGNYGTGGAMLTGGWTGSPGNATVGFWSAGMPTQTTADGAPGAWRLLAARVDPVTGIRINNLTLGTGPALAAPTGTRTVNARNIFLGWGGHTGFVGPNKIIRAAIYNRFLTDDELATMRAFIAAEVAAIDPAIVL